MREFTLKKTLPAPRSQDDGHFTVSLLASTVSATVTGLRTILVTCFTPSDMAFACFPGLENLGHFSLVYELVHKPQKYLYAY